VGSRRHHDDIIRRLDSTVQLPGLTNAWGNPIRTRIDMLSPASAPCSASSHRPLIWLVSASGTKYWKRRLKNVPGTRAVLPKRRPPAGRYIDIEVNRFQAHAMASRLQNQGHGGRRNPRCTVTTMIAGRERYSVNLRYRARFGIIKSHRRSAYHAPNGAKFLLSLLAKVSIADGPTQIKSEKAAHRLCLRRPCHARILAAM